MSLPKNAARGLSGWGRTFQPGVEVRGEDLIRLTQGKHLSRGLGRSYGDASLLAPGDLVASGTTLGDRLLSFDETTGLLRAEAGLSLAELNRIFLPRLWFTPVTPGTKFVTLGGMVASDVHGKNHHSSGTFGAYVESLLVRVGRGQLVECSREVHPDLFFATIGGMGLTGHILEVCFRMRRIPSTWLYSESYRIDTLEELLNALDEKGKVWPYTVAWADTITRGRSRGRGILFVGRWAEADEAPPRPSRPPLAFDMPFELPSGLLNRYTIRVFNELVFRSHFRRRKSGLVDPDTFFYPLDRVHHWNRAYGARGVTQHQSVVERSSAHEALLKMMGVLERAGSASFLTVVKDCGAEGEGYLSFPKPGISLALDLPIIDGSREIVRELNQIVVAHQGRIYLTKDGLSASEEFRTMEPNLEAFLAVKRTWDPEGEFRSAQSRRLFGI